MVALACCIASRAIGQTPTSDPQPRRNAPGERLRRVERRQQQERQQRLFPLDAAPPGARERALEKIQQAEAQASTSFSDDGLAWYNLGPSPIRERFDVQAGRVSAIAVDPFDQGHWLLGAAQGGIWESKDYGVNWDPRSDNQASLAIGALAFAPGNPKVVYAGTGEGNFSGDSYAGMGLLKSRDGGSNWFLVAGAPFAQTSFSEIKVSSSNTNLLVAATVRGAMGLVRVPAAPPRGIFVSRDGGTNWTRTLTGEATDVEVVSTNFNRQYAALGEIRGDATNGVYRTTDGGTNWVRINGPWMGTPGPTNIGRIRMALGPFTPDILYVSVAQKIVSGEFTRLVGIWRTDNAWATTPTWVRIGDENNPGPEKFAWYSHDLLIQPGNPDVVYFAGFATRRFDWLSFTWQNLTNNHADQHALAWWHGFELTDYHVIATHDGGLSTRADSGGGWINKDGTTKVLSITQFYKGAVHPYDSSVILGGIQDNGSAAYEGDPGWRKVHIDDGYSCAFSTVEPDRLWAAAHQNENDGMIFRSTDRGTNFNRADWGIDPNSVSFFIGFVKHPTIDNLFVAGANNLWRCIDFFTNTSPTWEANSPVLISTNGQPAEIKAMAFAPSDHNGLIYAYGTHDGQLRLTTDAGTNWVNIDAGGAVPERYVSGLAFSPTNAQELYVTLSGFDEGTPGHAGHVFKTTNALSITPTWLDISPPVNLPQDCVAINPFEPLNVFVGSDIGVWQSHNGGQSWIHHGPTRGMPNVAVFDLQFDSKGQLTAFTHGRGAFVFRGLGIITVPLCLSPCWPGLVNPEDLVSVTLLLHEVLPIQTVDVTATLRPTSQIVPRNGIQLHDYGSLAIDGSLVGGQFQFQATLGVGTPGLGANDIQTGCGSLAYAIFDIADSGQPLGSVRMPFRLGGRLLQPLMQNFESSLVPALPSGWLGSGPGGSNPWTSTSNGPPNVLGGAGSPDEEHVEDIESLPAGIISVSAFAPDPASPSDSALYSPLIPIVTDRAQLSFRHSFELEPRFDGAVLEISVGTQPFTDIVQAGGSFAVNGYNTNVLAVAGNPLAGRSVWSADSGGWLVTEVNLPLQAAGQLIQLRWRLASDVSIGGPGWFIDDVAISEYQCLPPVTNPVIRRPGRYDGHYGFFIQTVPTRTYDVEFKDMLDAAPWLPLQQIQGNGTEQLIIDPTLGPTQRFYRFRVE